MIGAGTTASTWRIRFVIDNDCGHSLHACPDNGMSEAIPKSLKRGKQRAGFQN